METPTLDFALIPLETCYRCAPAICTAANNLIAHNPDRCDKRLRPLEPVLVPGEVVVRQLPTDADERSYVASTIRAIIAGGCPPTM